MHRALIVAIGTIVVGWCVQVPQATAENPVCTATWCSFFLPSHNIGCEVSYQRGSGIADETYCQTEQPPQSVRMSTNGVFKSCTGPSCLGNAGQGTPTLAYGLSASLGPFTCRSAPSGVTCTVTSGRGFSLSNAGVTSVG